MNDSDFLGLVRRSGVVGQSQSQQQQQPQQQSQQSQQHHLLSIPTALRAAAAVGQQQQGSGAGYGCCSAPSSSASYPAQISLLDSLVYAAAASASAARSNNSNSYNNNNSNNAEKKTTTAATSSSSTAPALIRPTPIKIVPPSSYRCSSSHWDCCGDRSSYPGAAPDDTIITISVAVDPERYSHSYASSDRASGARNPSPEDEDEHHHHDEHDDEDAAAAAAEVHEHPVPLVRPVALRIVPPPSAAAAAVAQSRPQQWFRFFGRSGGGAAEAEVETEEAHPSSRDEQRRGAEEGPSGIEADESSTAPPSAVEASSSSSSSSSSSEEEEEEEEDDPPPDSEQRPVPPHGGLVRPYPLSPALASARDGLLHALAVGGGGTTSEGFVSCLDVLQRHYRAASASASAAGTMDGDRCSSADGTWLDLTRPSLPAGGLRQSDGGDPLCTLGQMMAFDAFSPSDLICSLQGNFTSIGPVASGAELLESVPESLRDEMMQAGTGGGGSGTLRTHNIVTAFTIEPPSPDHPEAPNRDVWHPIKCLMTTYGFLLPDPRVPHRQSFWVTGVRVEPNDDHDELTAWKRLFRIHPLNENNNDKQKQQQQHRRYYNIGERAKLFAEKFLFVGGGGEELPTVVPSTTATTTTTSMGDVNNSSNKEVVMAEDGSMEFRFARPAGGHGVTYIDTVYADDSLRVVRGHRGSVVVSTRLPGGRHRLTTTTTSSHHP